MITVQGKGRVDGLAKASGTAVYTDDVKLPNMAYAKVLRSPYPHARIVHIDVSEAEQVEGVIRIVTAKDIESYGMFGRYVRDIPVLANGIVRFIGERVAAVVAETEEAAEEAVALIEVEYEALPAVTDFCEALDDGAPAVHEAAWSYKNAVVKPGDPPNLQSRNVTGNTEPHAVMEALARSAYTFEGEFSVPVRHHGYLETQSCIVDATGEQIHIWAPHKAPYSLRKQLCEWFDTTDSSTFVIEPVYIGGDFGGKGSLMEIPLGICLSRLSGRSVKLRMTYAEDLIAGDPSHGSRVRVRIGVDEQHKFTALHVDALLDSGAYAGYKPLSDVTVSGIKEGGQSYRFPFACVENKVVYTNTLPRGHLRAPGSVQAGFAVESLIDIAVRKLGADPVEFRRKNLLRAGEDNIHGYSYEEVRGEEVLDAAVEAAAKLPPPRPPALGNWVYGTGYSVYSREAHGGKSEVALEPHADGTVTVWVAFTEQGAGQMTMAHNIVAESLGIPEEKIRVSQANTEQITFDSGTGGSRVTMTAGEALRQACLKLIEKLQQQYGLPSHQPASEEQLTRAIGELASATNGEWIRYTNDSSKMEHLTSCSVQIARVRVDVDSGEVVVEDIVTALDVANIINPVSHQIQVEGGIVHGFGDAMLSDMEMTDGRVMAGNLGEFKLPSVRDLPRLTVTLVEGSKGYGTINAKPIGELTTPGVSSAIANAIYDAVGVRLTRLPLKAEAVFEELRKQEEVR